MIKKEHAKIYVPKGASLKSEILKEALKETVG